MKWNRHMRSNMTFMARAPKGALWLAMGTLHKQKITTGLGKCFMFDFWYSFVVKEPAAQYMPPAVQNLRF